MEESGSQFHQTKFNLGFPYKTTDHRNPYSFENSHSRNFPPLPCSGPQFHPGFSHLSNPAQKRNLPSYPFDFGQKGTPTVSTAPSAQKRFLIFDQSGDKTTLVYSSGVEYKTNWMPKPPVTHNFRNEEPRKTTNDEQIDENSSEDEMREDTEELDALLCSDSDSYFTEDDEETSTGHSPSTMTDNRTWDLVEETGEEVDSFSRPIKRRKLPEGGYDVPSQMGTSKSSSLDDNGSTQVLGKRKERIFETVSVLQSLFPNAKGKDAINVIDEAICYLRSLKVKAKALGVDTL